MSHVTPSFFEGTEKKFELVLEASAPSLRARGKAFWRRIAGNHDVQLIYVSARDGVSTSKVKKDIELLMRERRRKRIIRIARRTPSHIRLPAPMTADIHPDHRCRPRIHTLRVHYLHRLR